jgi:ABC-2 type transport system permease protein
VEGRHLRKFVRSGLFVPSLLMPCMFFAAFAGGLSAVSKTPKFGYPSYTSFVFIFVLMLGASYVAAFSVAAFLPDLEGKFISRMMLAVPRRTAIIAGVVFAGIGEAVFIVLVLFLIGLAAGMKVSGSALQILAIVGLALLLNIAASLWALGLAMRVRSSGAEPLMQLPIFAVLFLTPVFVPRHLLDGWLKSAASVNPLTPLLEASRGLLVHQPFHVGLAYLSDAGLIVAFLVWALLGLRRAERMP